ncbi:MAG: DUF5684 domain-containing protein [Planctomycetes bacterium]|nr:DUF5684 domain-containing protein [Planctomycetota bacterium]
MFFNLAQNYDNFEGIDEGTMAVAGASAMLFMLVYLAIVVVAIAGMWKVFSKAGQPGWASIVPIYNLYVMSQIGGKEIIWFILCFVPIVNIAAIFVLNIGIAESFGKSTGYGVGLALLPFIFYPMLGFSGAEYLADGED